MIAKDNRACRIGRAGFTLIELLVVIVIIGILAALAIPKLMDARTRAKETEAAANLQAVRVAIEAFGTDHGGLYPFRMRWFDDATYNDPNFDPYTATDTGSGMTSDADSYFSLGLFGGVRVVDNDFNGNLDRPTGGLVIRQGMTEHHVVQPFGWDEEFYENFNQFSDPLVALGYINTYPENPFLRRPMGNIMWHYGDRNWNNGSGTVEYDRKVPGEDVVTTPGDFVYTHFYRVDNSTNPPTVTSPEGIVEASVSYKASSATEDHSGMYYLDLVDSYQLWGYGDLPINGSVYVAYPNNSLELSSKGRWTARKDYDNSGQKDMYEIGMIAYYSSTGTASNEARDSDGNRVEF